MANELRFLGGNLLFVGGSLAMASACCCDEFDCGQLATFDSTVAFYSAHTADMTVNGIACCGSGSGCSCTPVQLSAAGMTYQQDFIHRWIYEATLTGGCSCPAGLSSGACLARLWVSVACIDAGANVRISAQISVGSSDDSGSASSWADWHIGYTLIVTEATFAAGVAGGSPFTVPYASHFTRSPGGPVCRPTTSIALWPSSTATVVIN